MNKLILTLIALFTIATQVFSQAPQSFKYQAVLRDGAGIVLSNQIVSFQLSILEGNETGTSIYTETYTTTTNSYGLVNLLVGEGSTVNGDFTTINWAENSHFLKVELDETGGTTYVHIGTSKLNSVPYALNAKTAETAGNVFSGDYTDLSNTPDLSNYDTDVSDDFSGNYDSLYNKPILAGDVTGNIDDNKVEKIQGMDVSINIPSSGQVLKWNGTEWAPADDNTVGGSGVDGVVDGASFSGTTNKTLTLSRSNGLTPLTANFTDEIDDADADATNELITNASLNGTNLEITDAGGTNTVDLSSLDNSTMNINDADADATNEIQVLSISNDTIYLSDGGLVKLPTGFDGDYNNLSNQPIIPSNTSDLTNNSGFITNADDDDADATNELITNAVLSGTNLQITDAGGTKTVDLSSLDNAGTDSQNLSVSGNSLSISGGNTVILQDNIDDADADATNELQVLSFSNDTLYLSNGGQVYMGAYSNLWASHGNDIYNTNTHNVGVGLENPEGKLVVQGDPAVSDTLPLFEVKNKDGITVFAVYDGGIRMYVNDDPDKANNDKSGFAIGGYRLDKSITNEYMRVTPDSVRIYIKEENTNKANNKKGGFAIGGYRLDKSTPEDYLNIYAADTVYVIDTTAQMLWYPLKEAFLSGKVLIEHADSVGQNSWATGYISKSIGDYSQALGYRARANGDNSTAIGYFANADSINSYAFGNYALAQDSGAYAIGTGAKATGLRSFAIGSTGLDTITGTSTTSTIASGDYSYAFGMGANAKGTGSFATGVSSTAYGAYSIANGYNASAYTTNGIAIGKNSEARKTPLKIISGYSLALGFDCKATSHGDLIIGHDLQKYSAMALGVSSEATGKYSIAIGNNAIASGYRSFALGNNISVSGSNSFGINLSSTNVSMSATEAFSIMGADVGIGTTNPNAKVTIKGNPGETALHVYVGGNTRLRVNSDESTVIGTNNSDGPDRGLYVFGSTGIGISNPVSWTKLQVNANITNGYAGYFFNDGNSSNRWGIRIRAGRYNHSGDNYMIKFFDGDDDYEGAIIIDDGVLEIVQNSDATLKKNIFNTKVSANNMLNQIRIVDYSYKQGIGAVETGFIAQELLEVFPEMVIKDPETKQYGIKPLKLIPILTKANQEQQKMIDDLLIRIEKLEQKLEEK